MLDASPIRSSPESRRRAPEIVVAIACAMAVVSSAAAARASVVYGTTANIGWAAAPGDVSHYGVWVMKAGERTPASPTFVTSETQTTLAASLGDSIVIRVAAFYKVGDLGPFSPVSDPIHFMARATQPYDLDGDGDADLVLQASATSEHRALLLGPGGVEADGALPETDDGWQVSGSADFDGDGKADLLMWHPRQGAAEVWLMDGLERVAQLPLGVLGAGWFPRALGDGDASGAARVLWSQRETGQSLLWLVRRDVVEAQYALLPMDDQWSVWSTCDVDGNGVRDVIWVDEPGREARVWLMDDPASIDEVRLEHPGHGFWLQACGDTAGDGRSTIVWQSSTQVELWSMTGMSGPAGSEDAVVVGEREQTQAPRGSWIVSFGDQDSDGDADMALLNSQRGLLRTLSFEDGAVASIRKFDLGSEPGWEIASW